VSSVRRPLKFLFVAPSYIPFMGGAQAFQRAMATRLAADRHQLVVLTSNAREPEDFWRRPAESMALARAEILDGVTVERLSLAYRWPPPYAFAVLRRAGYWLSRSPAFTQGKTTLPGWLSQSMPPLPGLRPALSRWVQWADIVQVIDSSWDGLFTSAMHEASCAGRPVVAVPLMHLGDPAVRAHFQMSHQVAAYRAATEIVALSGREARAYGELGVAEERIHVVPMGVEPGHAVGVADEAALFRAERALDGPIVAFVGTTTFDKGAFTLALAVAQLNKRGRGVNLVCAGPGREGMAEFLNQQPPDVKAALSSRTHLLGVVDESTKNALLAACDLLALPSQVDSFGIVLLEAWLHGKPVIGADAGGIPDLIDSAATGLIVPFGSHDQLASAISRLLDDPELAARLGAAGRERVLQKFTWEHTYACMRQIYGI
jgi:glycogen synthase